MAAPTDISFAGGSVEERAYAGVVVASLTAIDPDQGDTFTYSMLDPEHPLFEIVGDEIRVRAGADVDFEAASEHTIDVRATDQTGAFYTKQITLSVLDMSEVDGDASANALTGTTGNDFMQPGAGDDTVSGGLGNDTIHSGEGADSLNGGDGDDHYFVDDAGDVIGEVAGAGSGFDIAWSAAQAYGLADNIEAYIAQGAAGDISGTGNGGNNNMLGNDGANTLFGLDGDDTILGGQGADTINGGDGGVDGIDIISGGEGADQLTGGAGHDFFNYETIAHAGDTIMDFTTGAGPDDDMLDLGALFDTFTNTAGVTTSADAVASGHLRVVQAGLNTQVFVDADGGANNEVLLATMLGANAGDVELYTLV